VYAIWNREWSVFVTIMVLYLGHTALFLTPNVLSQYEPVGPPLYGCKISPRTLTANEIMQLQLAANGLTVATDTIILGLTVMKTVTISVDAHRFGFTTPISNLLLRDGTVYFVALTILSTTNIAAIKLGPSIPLYGIISVFISPLRAILVNRFFLNLRHVFFEQEHATTDTLSFRVRVPTVTSGSMVGNLGAPLRSIFLSEPRTSESSTTPLSSRSFASTGASSLRRRQRRREKGKARIGSDPLLDWDVDDLDDEDLEDVEITSRRPMLVGLGIDLPDVRGESSGQALLRGGFGRTEIGEEGVPLIIGSNSSTPIRSAHFPSEGGGGRNSLPPSRQPSKSTAGDKDGLLVDVGDENEYSMDQLRMSVASTIDGGGRRVSPRRSSF